MKISDSLGPIDKSQKNKKSFNHFDFEPIQKSLSKTNFLPVPLDTVELSIRGIFNKNNYYESLYTI